MKKMLAAVLSLVLMLSVFSGALAVNEDIDGKIVIYASEAEFTDDPIEDGYFGVAGVAKIPNLQDKLIRLARGGFKHHTSICEGHVKDILEEAFTTYLHYDWVEIE